jgi:hypothetical protein
VEWLEGTLNVINWWITDEIIAVNNW